MTSNSTQPEDYADLVISQDKGRNYLFYIVVIVFVLALVGYFSLQSPEPEIQLDAPVGQQKTLPATPDSVKPLALPKTAKTSQTPTTGEADSASVSESTKQTADIAALRMEIDPKADTAAGESARSLIDSVRQGEKQLTLDQMFDQASALNGQLMSTDAYLLYFYAARKGHGPSALELGKMNDPAYFEAGNDLLDEPDPVQAHKWYSLAVEQNVAAAEEKLQALRGGMEAAAQAGDMSAQRLLLNWK